jgi:cobalt/nickel transport system ATP-binding protein
MSSEILSQAVLTITGLGFSYPDRPEVLQNINLEISPYERIGLIGPNGSGKTTLFLLICGVLQPSSGQIILFGNPVLNKHFRPDVGLVFQNPNDQLFCPLVKDDVAFGPQNMGLAKEKVDARVREALLAVNCMDMAERSAHHLSQGEKRMVAIATVLAMQPRLLIYDEPSANLDIRSRRRLIRLLQASKETLLVASHDLELILEVCERVVLIDAGRIVADGKPREILGDEVLMETHGQEKPHSLIPHQIPHIH